MEPEKAEAAVLQADVVPREAERSAVLIGAAEGLLEEVGARVYNQYTSDRSLHERTLSITRSRLGEEAFEAAHQRGRGTAFEPAVAYALSAVAAPEGPGL